MGPPSTSTETTCDVLVVGSGAGGLTTAIVAAAEGLRVLVVDKDTHLGGTAARSGGWLYVPGNPGEAARDDTPEAAMAYLEAVAGVSLDRSRASAFLAACPPMIEFFTSRTDLEFVYPDKAPDYRMEAPGARSGGRAIFAAPMDARKLGEHRLRIRPAMTEMTVFGVTPQIGEDLEQFVRANRSLASFCYVLGRIGRALWERGLYRRPLYLSNGGALVGGLVKSAADQAVPMWTSAEVRSLSTQDGVVNGAVLATAEGEHRVTATRGVVLACGGISHDVLSRRELYPHDADENNHFPLVTEGHSGDGRRLAAGVGAAFVSDVTCPAAWAPVSVFKGRGRRRRMFPHLRGMGLPGIVAVDRHGRRFTNESNSYHDFGQGLLRANAHEDGDFAFLVCDALTMHRYGLGYAKPWPMPRLRYRWNGYLIVGRTLERLATKLGIDPDGLTEAIEEYNKYASVGEDPLFHRGRDEYNWFRGDPSHMPNPSLAPVARAPFYATRVQMGDLGAFAGLRTGVHGEVLTDAGVPVPGLYALGSAASSVFGGAYPGYGAMLGPAMAFGYVIGSRLASTEK
jgi:succinate dehydrogenase/fumarate reductase flavoprotein subunit